jgi:geranylgeranyl diphosphate synthase, type II
MEAIKNYSDFLEKCFEDISFPKEPKNLYDPLRYIMTLGGKRIRPTLVILSYSMFKNDLSKVVNQATAIESFHNFTLIHDDIMDKAPLRRGKETVHTKWNVNVGILSGDALLIKSYQQLLKGLSQEHILPVMELFNTTAIEVCEGQQYDMDFESIDDVSVDDYIGMITLKTAVLLGAALKLGSIIGDASEEDKFNIYEFGKNIGISFQIQDDILDVYADENFGKQVGGDIIENKKTYLLLKAFELGDSKKLNNLLSIKDKSEKVQAVKSFYNDLNIKEIAEHKMDEYYDKAMLNLGNISVDNDAKSSLSEIAKYLMNRTV